MSARNLLSNISQKILTIDDRNVLQYDRSIVGTTLDINNPNPVRPPLPSVTVQPGAAQPPATGPGAALANGPGPARSLYNSVKNCVGALCPVKLKTNGGTRRKRATRKKHKQTRRR